MHFLLDDTLRGGLDLRLLIIDCTEVELRVVHILIVVLFGGKAKSFLDVFSCLGTYLKVRK